MQIDRNRIKTQYFVGASRKTQWSSVYIFSPHIPAVYEKMGDLFAIITLSSPPSFDSNTAGNLLIDALQEAYFDGPNENPFEGIDYAVKSAKKRLEDLIESDEIISQTGIELSLLLVVIHEEKAYLARIGEGAIFGFREGEMVEFTTSLKDPDGKGHMKTASLRVSPGDRFAILTKEIQQNISKDEIEASLVKFKLENIENKKFSDEALSAILLIEVEKEERADILEIKESIQNDSVKDEDFKGMYREFETRTLKERGDEEAEYKFLSASTYHSTPIFMRLRRQVKVVMNSRSLAKVIIYGRNVLGVLFGLLGSLHRTIKSKVLKIPPKEMLYINDLNKGGNKRPAIFFFVLSILLIYFIITGVSNSRERAKLAFEAEQTIVTSEAELTELENKVASIILTYGNEIDRDAAFRKVDEIKLKLEALKVEEVSEKQNAILDRLEEVNRKLRRIIQVREVKVVKDFAVIEGSQIADIDIGAEQIFVADGGDGKILAFDRAGGSMKQLATGLKGLISIAYSNLGHLAFIDGDPQRVLGLIRLSDNILTRVPGIDAIRLGRVNDIDAYKVGENDNRIYAARPESSQVIQMRQSAGEYILPEIRLENKDLGKISDLEVSDGRIYILSQDKGIKAFFGNGEVALKLYGLMQPELWNSANNIYVDSKYIYLSNDSMKRIAVFSKFRPSDEGAVDFIAQYDLTGLPQSGKLGELVASQQQRTIYVVLGSKIVKLDMSAMEEFTY